MEFYHVWFELEYVPPSFSVLIPDKLSSNLSGVNSDREQFNTQSMKLWSLVMFVDGGSIVV